MQVHTSSDCRAPRAWPSLSRSPRRLGRVRASSRKKAQSYLSKRRRCVVKTPAVHAPWTFDDSEKKKIIRNSVFPSLGYRFENSVFDFGSVVRRGFCAGGCRRCAICRAIFGANVDSIFDSTDNSAFDSALGDAFHAVFFWTDQGAIVHDALFVQIFFVIDAQKHDSGSEEQGNDGCEHEAQARVSPFAAHA
jgi:hypothetical protein